MGRSVPYTTLSLLFICGFIVLVRLRFVCSFAHAVRCRLLASHSFVPADGGCIGWCAWIRREFCSCVCAQKNKNYSRYADWYDWCCRNELREFLFFVYVDFDYIDILVCFYDFEEISNQDVISLSYAVQMENHFFFFKFRLFKISTSAS